MITVFIWALSITACIIVSAVLVKKVSPVADCEWSEFESEDWFGISILTFCAVSVESAIGVLIYASIVNNFWQDLLAGIAGVAFVPGFVLTWKYRPKLSWYNREESIPPSKELVSTISVDLPPIRRTTEDIFAQD